jgi:hypothetical protein
MAVRAINRRSRLVHDLAMVKSPVPNFIFLSFVQSMNICMLPNNMNAGIIANQKRSASQLACFASLSSVLVLLLALRTYIVYTELRWSTQLFPYSKA